VGDSARKRPDDPFARLREAERADRRRRYLETTPAQRLETAFELSDLASELARAVRRAR
jgi:hypothetical protein